MSALSNILCLIRKDAQCASFFALFFLFSNVSYSQVDSSISTPTTLGITAASIVPAFTVGGALYQNYATFWKNDNRVAFHISNDPPYSLQNDKFGHAYFTSLSADVIRSGYILAHVDPKTAAWLGSSFALATELLVEVEDGFHTSEDYYGFSPGDAAADIAGASIPLLKEYFPVVRRFDYKASMWPSTALQEGAYKTIFDDDESHFYWISYALHEDIHWWPAWINLSVGYSVENLKSSSFLLSRQGKTATGLFFIAPDINLKGIPIKGKFWEVFSSVLSNIRLPFPAVQVYPIGKVWLFR